MDVNTVSMIDPVQNVAKFKSLTFDVEVTIYRELYELYDDITMDLN